MEDEDEEGEAENTDSKQPDKKELTVTSVSAEELVDDNPNAKASSKKKQGVTETPKELHSVKEKIRKHRSYSAEKDPELLRKELLKVLGMEEADMAANSHIVSTKDLPLSGSEFFSDIGSWFNTVVANKQTALDQVKGALKPSMYH